VPLFNGPNSVFNALYAEKNAVSGLPVVGCTEDQLRNLWPLAMPVTLVGPHPSVAGVLAVTPTCKPARGYEPGDTCIDGAHNQLRVPEPADPTPSNNQCGTANGRPTSTEPTCQAYKDIVQEARNGREPLPDDPSPCSSSPHNQRTHYLPRPPRPAFGRQTFRKRFVKPFSLLATPHL
jgi:hypothetical protein